VSAAGLEELGALRGEIDEIARGARQISAEPAGAPFLMSYSFGIASSAEERITAIVESIKQTLAELAPIANLQTTVDGFTAKTVINYSGFAASVWSTGTTVGLIDAHLESIERAYALRAAVTAVVAAVGNAIVAISIAVANPLTLCHATHSAEALKSAVDRLAAAFAVAAPSSSASI